MAATSVGPIMPPIPPWSGPSRPSGATWASRATATGGATPRTRPWPGRWSSCRRNSGRRRTRPVVASSGPVGREGRERPSSNGAPAAAPFQGQYWITERDVEDPALPVFLDGCWQQGWVLLSVVPVSRAGYQPRLRYYFLWRAPEMVIDD